MVILPYVCLTKMSIFRKSYFLCDKYFVSKQPRNKIGFRLMSETYFILKLSIDGF